ncbi:basic salivary proline-rich protein 3-like [Grus americana]|uniref:basic salivary proline-rich protein 3-like n=1 Tax=Grus americana TaxID=9117 RepID=UPI0024082293|nr:basic salivary proline-rich protein 3-like [Grus americana]
MNDKNLPLEFLLHLLCSLQHAPGPQFENIMWPQPSSPASGPVPRRGNHRDSPDNLRAVSGRREPDPQRLRGGCDRAPLPCGRFTLPLTDRDGPNYPAPHSGSRGATGLPGRAAPAAGSGEAPGASPCPGGPAAGGNAGPARNGAWGAAAPGKGSGDAAGRPPWRPRCGGGRQQSGRETPGRPCPPLTPGHTHPRAPLPFPVSTAPPAPRAGRREPEPPAAKRGAARPRPGPLQPAPAPPHVRTDRPGAPGNPSRCRPPRLPQSALFAV